MKKDPDFYLVANECVPVAYPMRCWVARTLQWDGRDHYLVDVDPPLVFYDKDEHVLCVGKLVLAARYKDRHIKAVADGPVCVNILHRRGGSGDSELGDASYENAEIVALGWIYPNADSAWELVHKDFSIDRGQP